MKVGCAIPFCSPTATQIQMHRMKGARWPRSQEGAFMRGPLMGKESLEPDKASLRPAGWSAMSSVERTAAGALGSGNELSQPAALCASDLDARRNNTTAP